MCRDSTEDLIGELSPKEQETCFSTLCQAISSLPKQSAIGCLSDVVTSMDLKSTFPTVKGAGRKLAMAALASGHAEAALKAVKNADRRTCVQPVHCVWFVLVLTTGIR